MSWIPVLKAAEQRRLDALSVARGVGAEVLMDSAGSNAAAWMCVARCFHSVLVLAGPGGNGGDGFVVAQRLLEAGKEVRVISRAPVDALTGTTQVMATRVLDAGGTIEVLEEAMTTDDLSPSLEATDWIVDAWFGSGLSRPLQAADAELVDRVNAAHVPVVSLDLPSGLASDSGASLGPAIQADDTLAMQFYKLAHWFEPVAARCGRIHVMGVAYPASVLEEIQSEALVPTSEWIKTRLPQRPRDGHKGTFGRLLVVAGSERMKGASVLCCKGALRAGIGLLTLMHPASIAADIAAAVPEALTLPAPDRDGALDAVPLTAEVQDMLSKQQVLAIGPGVGNAVQTRTQLAHILRSFRGPVVVDADALSVLIEDADLLCRLQERAILTPHPGEMARLVGMSPEQVDQDRLEVARSYARAHGVILLLKGSPTVIALPDGRCVLNPTGNQGLATGGSGDVLTGLIAGFLASGAGLEEAAVLGAYVHGATADRWARRHAARSLTPSDLVDWIPETLKEIES